MDTPFNIFNNWNKINIPNTNVNYNKEIQSDEWDDNEEWNDDEEWVDE
jgi:hypothetical protein